MSLILAFFVTLFLHRSEVERIAQENLFDNGKNIIQSYESTPAVELKKFMQGVAGISNHAIQVFGPDGKPILDGQDMPIPVDAAAVKNVLAGGVVRQVESKERQPTVGMPFRSGGKPYALFLMLKTNTLLHEISKAIRTVLILVLIFGSLLILAAARSIVKPIARLTDATKRMAQGRFDVAIRTKRKDEIGQLTASFNDMAQELAKLDRMRQDFVASVSHEIQTPLTSISGFTKALKQKAVNEETRLHYLNIIEEESERLSRLGRNLLRLSSLQQEHLALNLCPYRVDEQLRKAVIALEPQWAAKEIGIDLEVGPITLHADEDQMNQVWINLLGNSIKFTPASGRIRVAAVRESDEAVISVSDTGIGIPAEDRHDIFKPFHTVDKSRSRSAGGNGLGLTIVKRIVDNHGGHIEVTGGPGSGSVFTVRLPLRMENP